MTNKLNIVLAAAAGIVSILALGLWFYMLQPNQQEQARQWETLLQTGIASFNQKQYQAALETLQRIPADSDQGAKARYYEGSAYLMLNDFDAAITHLEQALALDGHDTGAMYALGVAYYKLGKLKLAKSYFASVLELNPNDQQAKGLLDIMARLERYADSKPAAEETATEATDDHRTETTSAPGEQSGKTN